jgi:tRNA-modifying protein YgfZ
MDESIEALAAGEAFVDLSFWRKVEVSGSDAGAWLQDLVSADLADMEAGNTRRSLLLSATGRIRAEFTVARTRAGWLLLQDPEQPRPIDALLAPYVLSSDVTLQDRTGDLTLFSLPGRREPVDIRDGQQVVPSCAGSESGLDLITPIADHDRVATALEATFTVVGNEVLEGWRVLAGIPRFGVDATDEDLPQEAGLDDAVAFDKGCYLGQEAVAKVRNLGHPRRLVLHLRAEGTVSPGDRVLAGDDEVGLVTSAAASDGGTVLLARIGWEARAEPFRTALEVALVPAQTSSPV